MRLRTTLASAGIAAMVVGGLAVPAHAAPASSGKWYEAGQYQNKSKCIDAGQQYEREGWPYKCIEVDAWWVLEIWQ